MPDSLAVLRTRHGSDKVVLESTYRSEFTEAFKVVVPNTDREAIYETVGTKEPLHRVFRHWTFHRFWWDQVVVLVTDHFYEVYHEHINAEGEAERIDLMADGRP